MTYKRTIDNKYGTGDVKAAWRGIRNMSTIKTKHPCYGQVIHVNVVNDRDLADKFSFFSFSFEWSNSKNNILYVVTSTITQVMQVTFLV